MGNPFRAKGFQAFREESERRRQASENLRGKLYRFLLKDGETDCPIWFLTSEPLLFHEHTIKENGRFVNYTCMGSDCEYCKDSRASFKGAFLIVDGREYQIDERDKDGNKTGKKKTVTNRIRPLVRGQTDLATLLNKHVKFGLDSRPWFVTKVGSGQGSRYEYERGDVEDALTDKQIANLIAQLPERYHEMTLDEILEAQVFGFEDSEESTAPSTAKRVSKSDVEEDVKSRVRKISDKKPGSEKKSVVRKLARKNNS